MIIGLLLALQAGEPCTVVFDSTGNTLIQDAGGGQSNFFVGGGFVAHCLNQPETRIRSDSAAYYARIERLDLIRRVRIDDPSLLLTANAVTYFTALQRYEARGNVDARNPNNGLHISGPRLQYDRVAAGVRDTSELFAPGRPTINYYRPEDWERDGERAEPYEIIGDRARMRGDDRFWVGGQVTIDRSDFAAQSDSMSVDFTAGTGELITDPRLQTKDDDPVELRGLLISFELTGDTLSGLTAWGAGDLAGADFTLVGDTIDLDLDAGNLAFVTAWGDSTRPVAISDQYTIIGDSLAIDTPDEVLEMIRAFGNATAESRPPVAVDSVAAARADTVGRDSTEGQRPDTASRAAVDNLLDDERDWIAGDALSIRFVTEPDSVGGSETRPELLIARGSARAFYVVRNREREDLPPAISYSRADSIVVQMGSDGVERVDTHGKSDGVYLEPLPPVAPTDTASDSVSRDTAAVPVDSTRPPPDSGRSRGP